MKKITFFAIAMLAAGAMMAQTFVSTEPANRNAIIEEYTGIGCGYCPDGHAIVNDIIAQNPGRAYGINIHEGGYAGTTYTTAFGSALSAQTGLTGYPAGTVNRHVFSGGVTALSRGAFNQASQMIMAEASPVNVAARCTINYATRMMTVEVEAYYTGNSNVNTNMLNVAVLQDNILGQQANYGNYNPAQIVGNQYLHMHMLRHLITGQWGEEITTTSAGTFVNRTYTWHIPSFIGHNSDTTASAQNPVDVEPDDLEVLVFIAEGHQEIITGCKAEMTITNAIPKVTAMNPMSSPTCDAQVRAYATVINNSSEDITSLTLGYGLNNTNSNYTWNARTIAVGATDTIELPFITSGIQAGVEYKYQACVKGYNGNEVSGGAKSATVTSNVLNAQGCVFLHIFCDRMGSEVSWKFMRASDRSVIAEGGPYTNTNAPTHKYETLTAPEDGCFIFEMYDAAGNGINGAQYGQGWFTLSDGYGQLVKNDGKFGSLAQYYISITKHEDIEMAESSLSLYPNPAKNQINVNSTDNIRMIEIFNVQGQRVINTTNTQIDLSGINAGSYVIRVTTDNGVTVKNFVKE